MVDRRGRPCDVYLSISNPTDGSPLRLNLKDLGVKFSHKIELMMAILVVVYTFTVKPGLIKRFKIQMKKHRGGKIYQAVSTFRHRLSWLLCSFKNIRQLINVFQNIQSAKVTSNNPIST